MIAKDESAKLKVTFGSRFREDDCLHAEGNITISGGNYMWKAVQSHYGIGWEVTIDDNGNLDTGIVEFINAAISSSIDDNIVEAVYRIPTKPLR